MVSTASNQDPLLSSIKPVAQHFAERKHDEVQAFGYDKDLHHLEDLGEEDFLDLLGVDKVFLNVETHCKGHRKATAQWKHNHIQSRVFRHHNPSTT
jgi:hypothetical protein